GRSIFLIDDVLTTGVTVTTATKTLKHAGARQVNVLTFSRVLKNNFSLPYF
ncbi:MAG: ComF family protein, partial [Bartonella sp.]|nr:ComF family protein [Bartonella sp.]